MKILIIEDEKLLENSIKAFLETKGLLWNAFTTARTAQCTPKRGHMTC